MTGLNSGYALGRPTRRCAATGRELIIGEAYIATLIDDGQGPIARRADYSMEAWEVPASRPRGVAAFWKAHVTDPGQKKMQQVLDDDALADLFDQTETPMPAEALPEGGEQALAAAEQRRLALRFVITLLMLRRKLLVLESTRPGLMLVRPKGVPRPPEGPALLEVIDPGVDESTIISVIAELEGDAEPEQPQVTSKAQAASGASA